LALHRPSVDGHVHEAVVAHTASAS
jgi:hypothetical protein